MEVVIKTNDVKKAVKAIDLYPGDVYETSDGRICVKTDPGALCLIPNYTVYSYSSEDLRSRLDQQKVYHRTDLEATISVTPIEVTNASS